MNEAAVKVGKSHRLHVPLKNRQWLVTGGLLLSLLLLLLIMSFWFRLGLSETASSAPMRTMSVLIAETDFSEGEQVFLQELTQTSGVLSAEVGKIEEALKDVPWGEELPRLFAATIVLSENSDARSVRAAIGARFPGAITGAVLTADVSEPFLSGSTLQSIIYALLLLTCLVVLVMTRQIFLKNRADFQSIVWLGADKNRTLGLLIRHTGLVCLVSLIIAMILSLVSIAGMGESVHMAMRWVEISLGVAVVCIAVGMTVCLGALWIYRRYLSQTWKTEK